MGNYFNLYLIVHLCGIWFIIVMLSHLVDKVEKLMDLLFLFHLIIGSVIKQDLSLITRFEKFLKTT